MIMDFEWDAGKAARNLRHHGIAFEEAIRAFLDPLAVERLDLRRDYGEERTQLIGMCDGLLLHITYTEHGERIRIISARQAQSHEQDDYYRENSL